MRFLTQIFKRNTETERTYCVPDGQLVYAIGDIHGRFDLLTALVDKIDADRQQRGKNTDCKIIFLGDYVDRGFQSNEVVNYLAQLKLSWAETICLKGNHEAMMQEFIRAPEENEGWLHFGGMATLASYGVRIKENEVGDRDLVKAASDLDSSIPEAHKSFLNALPLSHRIGDYFFVHAGLRPEVEIETQNAEDMMFIRHEFLSSNYDFGVCVVHGHTGVDNPVIKSNRIAVDTTAYATGRLTAAVLYGADVDFLIT